MSINKIIRLNPESIPAPVGNYSHVTIIPKFRRIQTCTRFRGKLGSIIPEIFRKI